MFIGIGGSGGSSFSSHPPSSALYNIPFSQHENHKGGEEWLSYKSFKKVREFYHYFDGILLMERNYIRKHFYTCKNLFYKKRGHSMEDNSVKISRSLDISNVIFKPENIRDLVDIIYKEYERVKKEDKDVSARVSFQLWDSDKTCYESNKKEIFAESGILDTRRIITIKMEYWNFTDNKTISINLSHGSYNGFFSNNASISGYDEVWVNGLLKSIEDTLSHCNEQKNWFCKDSVLLLLLVLFSIGFAILFMNFFEFLISLIVKPHQIAPPEWLIEFTTIIEPVLDFIGYIIFLIFGVYLSAHIIGRLYKLYPKVELVTGPEYSRNEEIVRKRLYKLIAIGVVPLIISIIIEILKWLL